MAVASSYKEAEANNYLKLNLNWVHPNGQAI